MDAPPRRRLGSPTAEHSAADRRRRNGDPDRHGVAVVLRRDRPRFDGGARYRVQGEDRIEKHSKDVQLKRSVLDETYNRRTQIERTNDAVKDCGLGSIRARGRVHAWVQVFLALCLRVVVAITDDERGDNPGREILTA